MAAAILITCRAQNLLVLGGELGILWGLDRDYIPFFPTKNQ